MIKEPSLSTIFERAKEEMVSEERDNYNSSSSSVSIQTLFSSSFSSLEYHSSSCENTLRSEKGWEDKILSSEMAVVSPENLDGSDGTSDDNSTSGFPIEVKISTKSASRVSVWSKADQMDPMLTTEEETITSDQTKSVENTSHVAKSILPLSNSKRKFGHAKPIVIKVKPSEESLDFTEVENVSQNANNDDEAAKTEAKSVHVIKKRRDLYRVQSTTPDPSDGEVSRRSCSRATSRASGDQDANKVQRRSTKKVRFDDQHLHIIINESMSDGAIGGPDGKEQKQPTESESTSACDNVSDEEIKTRAASFISDILSRTLFESGVREDEDGATASGGASEGRAGQSSFIRNLISEGEKNVQKVLMMQYEADKKKNNSNTDEQVSSGFPYHLYIELVDAKKTSILKDCGSRYNHGDTFKARDMAEERAIKNQLIRLQQLKELLRKARDGESERADRPMNIHWLRHFLGKDTFENPSVSNTDEVKTHGLLFQ